MKKVFLVLCLALSAITFATSISEYFTDALNNSTMYKLQKLNDEINEMDYEKGRIEATDQKEILSAETNYLKTKSSRQTAIKNLYLEFIDNLFNAKTSELSLEIAKIQYNSAEKDFQNKKNLADKKIISDIALAESEMALEEAKMTKDEAEISFNNAKVDFERATSLPYGDIVLKDVTPESIIMDDEAYTAKNYDQMISENNVKLAEYEANNLSIYASGYDKKSIELRLEETKMNATSSKEQLSRKHESTIRTIKSQYAKLIIQKRKTDFKERNMKEMETRLEKGLIADSAFNNSRSEYINSKISYMESLMGYYKNIVNYLIETDRLPEAVMN